MKPVHTSATSGIYGAPPGTQGIGGLPYHRGYDEASLPGTKVPVIYSEWELDTAELEALERGGRVQVAIWGEPIRPFSLTVLEPEGADASPSEGEPAGLTAEEPR